MLIARDFVIIKLAVINLRQITCAVYALFMTCMFLIPIKGEIIPGINVFFLHLLSKIERV